jgi:hypothetical protein
MGEKRKRVYEALLDGASEGRSDKALYDFVMERCPKATSKKIVRASLLALTDPHVTDRMSSILFTLWRLRIEWTKSAQSQILTMMKTQRKKLRCSAS